MARKTQRERQRAYLQRMRGGGGGSRLAEVVARRNVRIGKREREVARLRAGLAVLNRVATARAKRTIGLGGAQPKDRCGRVAEVRRPLLGTWETGLFSRWTVTRL
jgi:hypothetical protein